MPLPPYTILHAEAKLSEADVEGMFLWTQTERNRLITESLATPQSSRPDQP